jgi:hypothetical protein
MTTKQEYIDILGQMEELYYNSDNCTLAMNLFKEDINLLTGLVNECFEENAETNYEHYKDEIIKNSGFQFALVDGKPSKCSGVRCLDCGFSTGYGCSEKIKEWLKSPYEKQNEKQKYKLSRFEYDLLNAYKVSGIRNSIRNYSALFELYEKGYFKDVDLKATIVEILDNCEVIK